MLREKNLPSRTEVMKNFMQQGFLAQINSYVGSAFHLVQYFLITSKELDHLKNHPYECVIYSQTKRMKRYLQGLAFLSQRIDQHRIIHCTDSYYPILKSLFELFVENRLANSYVSDFGQTTKTKKELAQRILDYTNLTRKRNNFKFNFIADFSKIPTEYMSEEIRDYIKKNTKQHREESNDIANRLGKGKTRDVRHWYPNKDNRNKTIIKDKRNDFGSMRWRCQDVLGQYLPNAIEKKHWYTQYDTLYELLNRYSHPVLGYDDNFRPEAERLFDLFHTLCQTIIIFDKFILPDIITDLKIRIENNKEVLDSFNEMESLKKSFLSFYGIAALVVNMEDYKN